MRRLPFAVVLLALASLAAQSPRPLPTLEAATRIADPKSGDALAWPELIDRLAAHDVVFLGETHVDDTTHRVELHVLEQLLAKKNGKVVLSMEMFERDVQSVVDDYVAGRIDEATFLGKARPWQNYDTAYRPLVEAAKKAGVPVVAANFPGSLRRKLGGDDPKAAIDALPPEQRALIPAEIFPASQGYWERVDRAIRGHMGAGGGGTPEERRYETQNLWDNAMGDNVAKAHAAHPGSLVLHVAGGFHVAYRDGTVAQFARRAPGAKSVVVSIAPTLGLHTARPDRDREQADFLVYAAPIARDFNEGNFAVSVPAELRYRLELPDTKDAVPLLVVLPSGRTSTDDAVAMWRAAVGDRAAVAIVEPPFPEVQDDLAVGGRYAFGDGFRADYSRVAQGLASIVEYVTRRLPVAASRIVIAGEREGGAAVLWTALYGEWLAADFVALDPTDLGRLSMEGLPDLPPVARSLHLFASDGVVERLERIAGDYRKVGTDTKVAALDGPLAARITALLELAPRPAAANADTPLFLVVDSDAPRAREWAALHAAMHATTGTAARVVTAADVPANTPPERVRKLAIGEGGHWSAKSFADGRGLPLAGGPFGGTTVVVLPAGTSDAERAIWLEHEKNKVLKRRSMFANIAIATDDDGELSLPKVLTKLKGMGRSRVLIVPATFAAGARTMQGLRELLGTAGNGMDVAWLPGLGGSLARSPH